MKSEINNLLKTLVKYDDQLRADTVDNSSNLLNEKEMPIKDTKKIKRRRRGTQETTSFDYDFSFNLNFEQLFKREIGIQVSNDFKEMYEEEMQCPLIGILGKSNTGKTFLLSKCFDLCDNYKKGVTEHTPTIALKYVMNKQILLIDSKGTGIALDNEYVNNESEQKLNLLCEEFSMKFILDCCGTIIYTMGNFDESEKQQYNLIKQSNPKMLIVIHNLPEIETMKDIENYIQNHIKSILDVQEYYIISFDGTKTVYYIEKENMNYIHCICGKWESDELEEMNDEVISFIRAKLLSDTKFKGINIINHISTFLEKFLIYNFALVNDQENSVEKVSKREQNEIFKVDIDIEEEKMKIQYENDYSFSLSKIGSMDNIFQCNSYRVYLKEPNIIIVEIDIMGPIDSSSAKIKGKRIDSQYYIVLFEAKYMYPKVEGASYIGNRKTYELFRADIKFAVEENVLITNLTKPNKSYDKGVFKLEYEYESAEEGENDVYDLN